MNETNDDFFIYNSMKKISELHKLIYKFNSQINQIKFQKEQIHNNFESLFKLRLEHETNMP